MLVQNPVLVTVGLLAARLSIPPPSLPVFPLNEQLVTAGLLPIAFSMEDTWGEAASGLPGRPGFPAFLTGRTDWAVRLDGELGEGLVYYELVGAVGEGSDLFGQRRGEPLLAARVTSFPLHSLDWSVELGPYTIPLVSGLFVNFAYAWSP